MDAGRMVIMIMIMMSLVAVGSVFASQNWTGCYVTTLKPNALNSSCMVKPYSCSSDFIHESLFSPPVSNLEVVMEMLRDNSSGQYLRSLASLRWNLQDRLKSVKDFLIHFQSADNTLNLCYALSLSEQSTKVSSAEDVLVVFQLPLTPNNYSVRVHSVTRMQSVTGSSYLIPQCVIIVKPRKPEFSNIPALWITDLVVFNNSCNRSISIFFELAPDAYEFLAYSALLLPTIKHGEKRILNLTVVKRQRQGSITFMDLPFGRYIIKLTPENTDPRSSNCRCKCGNWRKEYCLNSPCPAFGCAAIVSDIVSIDNVSSSDCDAAIDDPLLMLKVTGIVVGCLLAVGLLLVVIIVLRRPRHIDINLQSLPRQPLLLLYSSDDESHCDVIHCLLHLLQQHCSCSVTTMHSYQTKVSENLFEFIEHICTNSDKILLINSDGIARGFISEHPVMTSNPLDPLINTVLEHLQRGSDSKCDSKRKLTIARFDYTRDNNIADRIRYRDHEFQLMRELEQLLLHLHGYPEKMGRNIFHLKNFWDICKSIEGDRLSLAINSALETEEVVGSDGSERTDVSMLRRESDSCSEEIMEDTIQFIPPSEESDSQEEEIEEWSRILNSNFDSNLSRQIL